MIQISSGRGPAECCWVVAQVLKKILEEAKSLNLKTEVIHREKGIEDRTLFSAAVLLKGEKVNSFLTQWLGVIQWIGQSQFRKLHKRKNWFVGVSIIELNAGFNVDESQIKYEAIRSNGPGGQHVNKVSSAVRAIHIPSGKQVLASDSKSQHQNKKKATERLLILLNIEALEEQKRLVQNNWKQHNELERGNPIRIFKGSDFKSNPNQKKKNPDRQQSKKELKNWREDD